MREEVQVAPARRRRRVVSTISLGQHRDFKPLRQPLTDQTKVGGLTWDVLRENGMAKDYASQTWFVSSYFFGLYFVFKYADFDEIISFEKFNSHPVHCV